jgi:hypothetical protein
MMAIFGLVIAGAVAAAALLQWWVARSKLRLDLFDRRYKVYEATRTLARDSVRYPAQIDRRLAVFNDETSNAEFLFDADVVDYLQEVRKRAADDDLLWLSDPARSTEITTTFAPYLRFANVRSTTKRHIAREWLIFLMCIAFGLVPLYFIYNQDLDLLFGRLTSSAAAWLGVLSPYLVVFLLRSINWSVDTLRRR